MTVLPIAQRELYVASRRRLTFWARAVAALVALGVAVPVFVVQSQLAAMTPGLVSGAALGGRLFWVLTHVAFFGCLFAGILLSADCISSERREDTLGLLFLTDLKGYDVVLGKLASRSLLAVYCLLAIVPVAAAPLLLGGVTFGEFARVTVVLLNTLFLSLAAGVFVSTFCREAQTAVMFSEVVVLSLGFVCPGLASLFGPASFWGQLFGVSSPLLLFQASFETISGQSSERFVPALALQLALGLALLAAASWRLPRCWQVKPGKGGLSWAQRWWQGVKFGSPARRGALRRRLLDPNPLCWLGSRDRVVRWMMWGLAVVLVGLAGLMNSSGSPWTEPDVAIGSLFFVHGILKFVVATDAANRMDGLRRTDMIALLWGTRLSVSEIMRGQLLAMRRLFAPPVLAALAYDLFWLYMCLTEGPDRGRAALVVQFVCVVAIFLWDLHVVAWVGLWGGYKCKRAANGVYLAVLQVLVLPWVLPLLWLATAKEPGRLELTLCWAFTSALANWSFRAIAGRAWQRRFHPLLQERAARASKPRSG
jgi:ABC-type transport system involved in multi-copper enzyme maturation permease subunit